MKTRQRAEALATAVAKFPLLGKITTDDLLETLRQELGHPEILDAFRPYGNHWSRAQAKAPFLHILSGATPHAALQSLLRGLLLNGKNFLKLPSKGLPEVREFIQHLPDELQRLVETSTEWNPSWPQQAQLALLFGSDESLLAIRKKLPLRLPVLEYGHKLSFALIWKDCGGASLPHAAAAISEFNQQGCLSPQVLYVRENKNFTARSYAARLAEAMDAYDKKNPRGSIDVEAAAAIMDTRANYRFRADSDPRVQLWTSEGNDHWTVIFEEDPWFVSSCLNRVVFVKPWPEDPAAAFEHVREWFASASIFPTQPEFANLLADLGIPRITSLEKTQFPPFSWHQEGRANLAAMVEWFDFEQS